MKIKKERELTKYNQAKKPKYTVKCPNKERERERELFFSYCQGYYRAASWKQLNLDYYYLTLGVSNVGGVGAVGFC
jgi:hypothetical protein